MDFINKLSHSSQDNSAPKETDTTKVSDKITHQESGAVPTPKNKPTPGDEGTASTKKNHGLAAKLNSAAGGGAQGEADEDALDKGVDFAQEKFLGQGQQSDETAAKQAKDEFVSDQIRDRFKTATGKDFPVQDKDKKYGA